MIKGRHRSAGRASGPGTFGQARRPDLRRRGAAATELAILLPFLVFCFSVTLDFCRAYHVTQTIQASAQAAALYASGTAEGDPEASRENAAKQAAVVEAGSLQPPLTADKVAVTIGATTVSATVTYEMPLLTPFLGESGTLKLDRTTTMNLAP